MQYILCLLLALFGSDGTIGAVSPNPNTFICECPPSRTVSYNPERMQFKFQTYDCTFIDTDGLLHHYPKTIIFVKTDLLEDQLFGSPWRQLQSIESLPNCPITLQLGLTEDQAKNPEHDWEIYLSLDRALEQFLDL